MPGGKTSAPTVLRLATPVISRSGKAFDKFKPVFILSTGRTATKFLADYFDSHPDITALHEPKPSRILRLWSMARLEGKVSDKRMAEVLRSRRRGIVSRVDTPIYIESNPYLTGFADTLHKVFKDPVIIHVVRDPRDFARSSVNHGNSVGIKWFFNNYVPYWYPEVDKLLKLGKLSRMEHRAAAYWKIANRYIAEAGKDNRNYHLLRFEDIFDEKQSGLKAMEKILGISMPKQKISKINKSSRNISSSWEDWSREECRTINKICQPDMKMYGYGMENEWQERVRPSG